MLRERVWLDRTRRLLHISSLIRSFDSLCDKNASTTVLCNQDQARDQGSGPVALGAQYIGYDVGHY
jgi:hypothetical protein